MARKRSTPARRSDRLDKLKAQTVALLYDHPLLGTLASHGLALSLSNEHVGAAATEVGEDGVVVSSNGRGESPATLVWLASHALLHLAFDQLRDGKRPELWHLACDVVVARFLDALKLPGRPWAPELDLTAFGASEEAVYQDLLDRGVPDSLRNAGFGSGPPLTPGREVFGYRWRAESTTDWTAAFGRSVTAAVEAVVEHAAGKTERPTSRRRRQTPAQTAFAWCRANYPLLGALAANFELIELPEVCRREAIAVAAVCPEAREIYVNPGHGFTDATARFVICHELLHVGLSHHTRCRGRDPFLWNVACDYVINGWLVAMEVGEMPADALFEPAFDGLSAEEVYDRIVCDLRRCRRLATLRGVGACDILERRPGGWWSTPAGVDLDSLFRRCLCNGLARHGGRGLLPAGLIEAIRAIEQPPVDWDVELARWFDEHFPPLEATRSYARLSRRQMATPDIPRPRWVPRTIGESRTFGVVLDSSGSLDRVLIGKALGAIAAYAITHDVAAVRVIMCDARPHDAGWLAPEQIAGRVEIRGRGGTILQPAIDLLEAAADFPNAGPLLILTDGLCDRLTVRREHAYVVPAWATLPHVPRGPVFRMTA